MRITLIAVSVLALATGASSAIARDYEAGKKKAAEVCAACHGEDGNKPLTPDTPKLGGQYYDYLVHALEQYKNGKRQNPLMSPMAAPLSKEDIRDLSFYFSKQQGLDVRY
ncbi:MAG: cytochrome c [Burkholderiales bacterium]|nr:cytochrome c [Burkholderiales bacterium]